MHSSAWNFCDRNLKSKHQLQTLDDLMAQAEHYAGWAMREIGNVPPTMMGLSP